MAARGDFDRAAQHEHLARVTLALGEASDVAAALRRSATSVRLSLPITTCFLLLRESDDAHIGVSVPVDARPRTESADETGGPPAVTGGPSVTAARPSWSRRAGPGREWFRRTVVVPSR